MDKVMRAADNRSSRCGRPVRLGHLICGGMLPLYALLLTGIALPAWSCAAGPPARAPLAASGPWATRGDEGGGRPRGRESWRDALCVIGPAQTIPDSVSAIAETWTHFALGLQEEMAGRPALALEHYKKIGAPCRSDPEILTHRAGCLHELRRHEEALTVSRQALASDSLRSEALWIEAASLVALGRLAEAIDPLRTMIRQRRGRRALNLLISVLDRLKRYEELLEQLDLLVSLNPSSPHQRERRASLLTRLGRFERALEDYWAILEISPEYPGVPKQMDTLIKRLGRTEELVRLYRTLTQRLPGRPDLRWKLVEALLGVRAWKEAEAELLRLRELDPENGLPVLQLGLIAYRRSDQERASELIEQAASMGVGPRLILPWKMRTYFARGRSDSALATADELVRLVPRAVEAWRIRTICLMEARRLGEALASIERWAILASTETEPLLLGAMVCREQGSWDQGLVMMKQAVARAPGEIRILLEYAAFLEAVDRIEEAEGVLESILKREPEQAETLNFLGYMWVDRGVCLEKAEEMLRKAVRLEPDNPAILDSMGWLWYKKGDLDRAEQWLERSVSEGGRHPEIYRHLARIRMDGGKTAEARQALELGLKWNPQDRSLLELRLVLEGER